MKRFLHLYGILSLVLIATAASAQTNTSKPSNIEVSAELQNGKVRISWNAGQSHVEAFLIERSFDGKDFSSRALVMPDSTDKYLAFSFLDNVQKENAPTAWYRVKVQENDQVFSSQTIAVKLTDKTANNKGQSKSGPEQRTFTYTKAGAMIP